MKKIYILLVAGALMVVSCEKDKKTSDNNTSVEPKNFSPLTPEAHKSDIQTSAIELVDDVNTFVQTDGVAAIAHGIELMENSDELKSTSAGPVKILKSVDNLASNRTDISDFMMNYSVMAEGDENIQALYDSIKGTYTYSFVTEDFEYTSGSQLVIIYPSSDEATTNDARFEVTDFTTQTYTADILDEMGGVLPVAVTAQLTVGSSKVMEFNFNATYHDNGTPTSISASLMISNFVFSTTLSNKENKDLSWETSFKQGETNIISFKAGLKGVFTEQNINDNTIYIVETEVYDPMEGYTYVKQEVTKEVYDATVEGNGIYKWQEVDIENILHTSYAYMDISNLRIGGEINVKEFVPPFRDNIEAWDDADDLYWENWEEGMAPFDDRPFLNTNVQLLNEHTSFFAAYIDDNLKIANLEFYVTERQDSSFNYDCIPVMDGEVVVDYNCGYFFEGMETRYYIDGRMVFGDDSKIAAETYFSEGFSNFFDKINELIATMNTEFDAGMDSVDYESFFE